MSAVSSQKNIRHHDHTISAILTTPLDTQRHPCVILLHGTCSDKNEVGNAYVYLASQLAHAGYASLRFDFIGCGESDADSIHYSYQSAVDDTQCMIDYVKDLGYEQISLIGWSQGAAIAMLSANEHIQALITLAGAYDMKSFIRKEDAEEAKKAGFVWYDPGFKEPVRLSLEWFEDVKNTDVLKLFAQRNLPLLAIHGVKDTTVDPKYSKKSVDACRYPLSRVIYLDECNHIFNVLANGYDYFAVAAREIIEWLNEVYQI